MSIEKTVKIKFLFGLIYLKIDKITTQWELRLFGITFLKSRIKNVLRSKEIVYLLGFIPIFYHSILNRLRNNYMKTIFLKYPEYDNYIVFASGCGEIFWAYSHLEEFIQKNKIENPLIICQRNILKHIYNMFSNLKYPIVVEDNCSGLLLNYKNKYNNKLFIVPLNYRYFGQNEKNIIKNKVHYYDELKKQLDVKNNPILKIGNINDKTKAKIQYLAKGILRSKFVIIMPEARTIKEIDSDFWEQLILFLREQGYEIFYNCSFIGDFIEGTINMYLSFEEFIELSQYSSAIIGLRNGLLEVLSVLTQKPTFAIYNKLNQYAQNKLNAKQAIIGFSMYNLPSLKENNIYEYNYEASLKEELLQKIINDLYFKLNTIGEKNVT